jgi:hypothetical protein
LRVGRCRRSVETQVSYRRFSCVGGGGLRAPASAGELRFGAEVEVTSASYAREVTSEDDATAITNESL